MDIETGQPFVAPEQVLPNDSSYACLATDRWQLGLIVLQLLCHKTLTQLIRDHFPHESSESTPERRDMTAVTNEEFELMLTIPSACTTSVSM